MLVDWGLIVGVINPGCGPQNVSYTIHNTLAGFNKSAMPSKCLMVFTINIQRYNTTIVLELIVLFKVHKKGVEEKCMEEEEEEEEEGEDKDEDKDNQQ